MNLIKIQNFIKDNCPKCINYNNLNKYDACELTQDLNGDIKCKNLEVKEYESRKG